MATCDAQHLGRLDGAADARVGAGPRIRAREHARVGTNANDLPGEHAGASKHDPASKHDHVGRNVNALTDERDLANRHEHIGASADAHDFASQHAHVGADEQDLTGQHAQVSADDGTNERDLADLCEHANSHAHVGADERGLANQREHANRREHAASLHAFANRHELRGAKVRRAVQAIAPATRRFVLRRDDGCCVVPGCRHATWLDVHHLEARADGGGPEPSNLITLCGAHHRALHRGELLVEGQLEGGLIFRHADESHHGSADSACGLGKSAGAALRDHAGERDSDDAEGPLRRCLRLLTDRQSSG